MTTKKDSKSTENEGLTLDIGKRLKEERLRLGIKATDFESYGGWPASTVYGWEAGKASPKSEFYATTQQLGLDIGYIITGHRSEQTFVQVHELSRHRYSLTGPAPAPTDTDDTVFVPLLAATGSMGPGSDLLTEDVVMGDVPMSRRWLALHLPGCRPGALRFVHAYGDSMRGTMESGDFGLVDTDVESIEIDGVYVLQAHNRLFIKRVTQRLDGSHVVSSDNPLINQTDVLNGMHEVRVCGRVVYGWNGRRF